MFPLKGSHGLPNTFIFYNFKEKGSFLKGSQGSPTLLYIRYHRVKMFPKTSSTSIFEYTVLMSGKLRSHIENQSIPMSSASRRQTPRYGWYNEDDNKICAELKTVQHVNQGSSLVIFWNLLFTYWNIFKNISISQRC